MIDIENEIFDELYNVLDPVPLFGEDMVTPSEFPCVTVVETDNYCYEESIDSGSNENHIVVLYDVNVYSNKVGGKKTESKKILKKVDDYFLALGFRRISRNQMSMNDNTIMRLTARYEAVVGKNKQIYRR